MLVALTAEGERLAAGSRDMTSERMTRFRG